MQAKNQLLQKIRALGQKKKMSDNSRLLLITVEISVVQQRLHAENSAYKKFEAEISAQEL